MRNIGIIETHDTVEEFITTSLSVDEDVKIIKYEPKLLKDEKFLQSIEKVLIIGQNVRLDTLNVEKIKKFSTKNSIFILTHNFNELCQKHKKEYTFLKSSVGLILEGNILEG